MAVLSTKSTGLEIWHGIVIIAQIVMFGFILVFCCIHGGSVTQNQKPEIQATIISKKILLQMWILFCTIGLHLWTISLALFIRIVVLTKELTWQLDPIVVEKVASSDKRFRQMLVYSILFTMAYNIFFLVMFIMLI